MNNLTITKLNIWRKPIKSLTLFLIIFLLITLVSGALSIQSAIQNTERNLRSELPPMATLIWNAQEAERASEGWQWATREMIEKVGSLPYVKAFDFSLAVNLYSDSLKRFNQFRENGVELFSLKGINNSSPIYLQGNIISLINGRFPTQEELDKGLPLAVISRNLAVANSLEIGSIISLENKVHDIEKMISEGIMDPSFVWQKEEFILARRTLEFEVAGLFDINLNSNYFESETGMSWLGTELENQIFIPYLIAEDIFNFDLVHASDGFRIEEMYLEPVFILEDFRDFCSFSESAVEILPDFWEIADLSAVFGPLLSAMNNMEWLAYLVLWITITSTVIILSLLMTLFLRERRAENGIYLALGKSKSSLIGQTLMEVLFLAGPALLLALAAGHFFSDLLSRHMIEQTLLNPERTMDWLLYTIPFELTLFNPGMMSIEEMIAAYDTSLSLSTILSIFGLGLFVILVATIMPMAYLLQLNPKKILLIK